MRERGAEAVQGSPATPEHRLLALDVLRALAVLLVLVHHAPFRWLRPLPGPTGFWQGLQRGGWVGVDLFFVLSGFLIAGLLFREHKRYGSIHVGRFFLRRGLKIYPAFWVLVAVTLLYPDDRLGNLPGDLWRRILAAVFFVQNYFGGLWGHTWTLAIEEHFYLFLPLLLLLLPRIRGARANDPFAAIPRICLVMSAIGLVLRWREPQGFLVATHLRMDALMFGVLLSWAYHYRVRRFVELSRRFAPWLIGAGIWLVLPAFLIRLDKTDLMAIGLTQIYVGFGLVVAVVVAVGVPSNRWTRPIAWIGTHSYSIYLWHWPVRIWQKDASLFLFGFEPGPTQSLLIYILGSLVVGVVMSRLVELPVLRIRDRFLPSRSRATLSPGGVVKGSDRAVYVGVALEPRTRDA